MGRPHGLRGEVAGANLQALHVAQRRWLDFIREQCGVAGAMPGDAAARAEATRCQLAEMEWRAGVLDRIRPPAVRKRFCIASSFAIAL